MLIHKSAFAFQNPPKGTTPMLTLTNHQARQFMLLKQGLTGEYKFAGKQGVLDFIYQAGCLQFDPIDICGKNAEITLQSRVKGFTKATLYELLYHDRKLFDYPDKQLSIIPIEFWPYFSHFRQAAKDTLIKHPEIAAHFDTVRAYIEKNGAICSDDIKLEGSTKWWSAINWSSGGKFLRSVLEQMYSSGDLIVHHKKGARRYYHLAEKHISADILNAPNPLPDEFAQMKWFVLRRIGAVGLLWNSASGAWLNIWGLTTDIRNKIFAELLDEGMITEVAIEGLKNKFYICTTDMPIIDTVLTNPTIKPRCEFIAPLDSFVWDKKLIRTIFDFDYSWEIYTPAVKRKYGVYVLPILYGEQFIGRIEVVCERKTSTLIVKNIWYEDGIKQTKKLEATISACIKRFATFNGANSTTS